MRTPMFILTLGQWPGWVDSLKTKYYDYLLPNLKEKCHVICVKKWLYNIQNIYFIIKLIDLGG